MDERLRDALLGLVRCQDRDSVNEVFGGVFCGPGQFARVDLDRGLVEVRSVESGALVRSVRFVLGIKPRYGGDWAAV